MCCFAVGGRRRDGSSSVTLGVYVLGMNAVAIEEGAAKQTPFGMNDVLGYYEKGDLCGREGVQAAVLYLSELCSGMWRCWPWSLLPQPGFDPGGVSAVSNDEDALLQTLL